MGKKYKSRDYIDATIEVLKDIGISRCKFLSTDSNEYDIHKEVNTIIDDVLKQDVIIDSEFDKEVVREVLITSIQETISKDNKYLYEF